jgi:hypothetical protein
VRDASGSIHATTRLVPAFVIADVCAPTIFLALIFEYTAARRAAG